jgi:plastocyanin
VRRVVVLALAGGAGLAAAIVPALAADQTVMTSNDNTFTPATVTINVHEKVTFQNQAGAGDHNLHFESSSSPENQPTVAPWTITKTFDTPGTFGFYCDVHRASGMVGSVVVVDPGGGGTTQTTTDTTPAPVASPPIVEKLRVAVRAKTIVISYRLANASGFTATVDRRSGGAYRRYGTLRATRIAASGSGTRRFTHVRSGKKFKAGKYRLRLVAVAADGAKSAAKSARFTVPR